MFVNKNRILLVVISVAVGCLVNMPQMKLKDPMMKAGAFAVCLYLSYTFLNSQGLIEASWLGDLTAKVVTQNKWAGKYFESRTPFKVKDVQRLENVKYCKESDTVHNNRTPVDGTCDEDYTLTPVRTGVGQGIPQGSKFYCRENAVDSYLLEACIDAANKHI